MIRSIPCYIKHTVHVCLLLSFILVIQFVYYKNKTEVLPEFDPIDSYGLHLTLLVYLLRYSGLLAFPQTLFNFLGLITFNAFANDVYANNCLRTIPFICIRVVTRGDFPDLVKTNVHRHLETCQEVGLDNFIVEVVTDRSIGLQENQHVREIVVPPTYSTKTGALFKARALQYCWEEHVNVLNDEDWVVHLDEETVMTTNSMRGILNFVLTGDCQCGQGLITYANDHVVNWLTTLADSFRVGDDMGKLQLQFRVFGRPLFGWKGSYAVIKAGTERQVTYDHGPDGSVAEDCFFSMVAYHNGYKFGFIDGEMWERSAFTLYDFLQQRKRWIQGTMLVVHSNKIPVRCKIFLSCSLYAWLTLPLHLCNLVLCRLFPLPFPNVILSTLLFILAVNIYMYMFGILKTFSLQQIGPLRMIVYLLGAASTLPVNTIIEVAAVILGLFQRKHRFYVVRKELPTVIPV